MARIIIALNATNLGRFWSQATGAAFRRGNIIRFGLVGSADISGILIDGRRAEIEVKTGLAKQSDEQVRFQKMIEIFGGAYLVARSEAEALMWLKSLVTGAPDARSNGGAFRKGI